MRDERDIEPMEDLGLRLAEHELETGNAPCANFLCKIWAYVGSPGRGLVQFVARRFCALALRNMVRLPRERPDPFLPGSEPPERPRPTPQQQEAREERRAMLAEARQMGMGGGLDLRYLPRNWRHGIQDSLFRKFANALECRHAMLLADGPALPPPQPDPGPFPVARFGKARVWVSPDSPSFRFHAAGTRGSYPGAFPVTPRGRVLQATIDLALFLVTLAYRPWGGKVAWPTAPARAWMKAQARARASPQPA